MRARMAFMGMVEEIRHVRKTEDHLHLEFDVRTRVVVMDELIECGVMGPQAKVLEEAGIGTLVFVMGPLSFTTNQGRPHVYAEHLFFLDASRTPAHAYGHAPAAEASDA